MELIPTCQHKSTLVPEAFFYSLLANFGTRIASYIFFLLARSAEGSALPSALRVANFYMKKDNIKRKPLGPG